MSRFIGNVHVYELEERIHIHLWVGSWSATSPRTQKLYELEFRTGREEATDPSLWLKALLVECIEAL